MVSTNPPLTTIHHIATLKEIALYKQARHSHLSALPHFQHWTTVSHAWSTSSAKLTALTVLLVGETYTRGLLPHLPFDCWCHILSIEHDYTARAPPRQVQAKRGGARAGIVQVDLKRCTYVQMKMKGAHGGGLSRKPTKSKYLFVVRLVYHSGASPSKKVFFFRINNVTNK